MADPSNTANTEKLRILMVTPRYLPEMGGVENHVYQVAARLVKAGVVITVLTTDREGTLRIDEMNNGVRIHRVRAWPSKRDYYFAPGIYDYILRSDADLIHIQSYHTLVAPLAMQAARKAKTPYVLTFHGGGHSSWLRNTMRTTQLSLLRPLLVKAERLVTLAKFEEALYSQKLRIPGDHFTMIPNGSDLPSQTGNKRPKDNGTLIASIGRLERYKGHHRIIAALPAILSAKPDTQLWIAGRGPYEPALRKLVKKLGIEEHVRFEAIPPEDRNRMAQEIERANLVVLLSDYETHPIAVLEALALGCPALVSETTGLTELCDLGLAKGIPLNSTSDQIANAVLEQIRNPLIPVRVSFPTWDDCAQGLLHLYEEVATRKL